YGLEHNKWVKHSDVFAKDAIDAYYCRYPNAPRRIASAAFDSLSFRKRDTHRPTSPVRSASPERPPSPGTSSSIPPDSIPLRPPSSGRSHWNVLCDQARDHCRSLRTHATG
ncbi:hypothetical protein K438DRAFT_1877802, partial [Mycena galopus ATCC 62051]